VLPIHGWRYVATDHVAYCSMWVALLLHISIHNTSFDLIICILLPYSRAFKCYTTSYTFHI
jgi:hypothetical protein